MEVYLDNSATTQPFPEVIQAVRETLEQCYGNPSSLHHKGLEAEKILKNARRLVAEVIGAADTELIFTSGGTEANNLAISGALGKLKRGDHLVTSQVEHPSVLNVFKRLEQQGYQVTYLPVDHTGMVDLNELRASLEYHPVLVSIMLVNNEIGAIQPLAAVGQILGALKNKPLLHVDAVQAFGKLPCNVHKLNIDLLTLSGHKFHGPKGVGALYIRKGIQLEPLVYGGGQEAGYRSGTENVPGIAGMGVAAALATADLNTNILKLRQLKAQLAAAIARNIETVRINSLDTGDFAPHILNVSFPGVKGEVLLHALEQDGIYVSTGAACSSRKNSPSHVLKAIGLKETEIEGAIRFSFSTRNTETEIDYVSDQLTRRVRELRRVMRGN
jgi:cysteine desulfurase